MYGFNILILVFSVKELAQPDNLLILADDEACVIFTIVDEPSSDVVSPAECIDIATAKFSLFKNLTNGDFGIEVMNHDKSVTVGVLSITIKGAEALREAKRVASV
jgi:hypothetical protein